MLANSVRQLKLNTYLKTQWKGKNGRIKPDHQNMQRNSLLRLHPDDEDDRWHSVAWYCLSLINLCCQKPESLIVWTCGFIIEVKVYFSLTLYAWLSTGRSALHADRSIATLQASEGEPCARGDLLHPAFLRTTCCLLQVPNCPEPCRDVTETCRAWWAGAAWSIRVPWPKRECLLWLIASFMDGSCERVATSTFVTNSHQRMPSIRRLWFVIWKAVYTIGWHWRLNANLTTGLGVSRIVVLNSAKCIWYA